MYAGQCAFSVVNCCSMYAVGTVCVMKSIVPIMGMLVLMYGQGALAADAFDFLRMDMQALQTDLVQMRQERLLMEEENAYQQQVGLYPLQKQVVASEDVVQESAQMHGYVEVTIGTEIVVLTDVSHDQWFAQYVEDMARRRIIGGYTDAEGKPLGKYGPGDPVTVEQLAKIAVQAAGVQGEGDCPGVLKNDGAAGRWSEPFMRCAEQRGWSVFSDGTVDPLRTALRFEVVTTVLEAFERSMEGGSAGAIFRDVSNTMPARYAIQTAAMDGIVSGYTDADGKLTGYFGPFDTVNRAETAKIVSLALATYVP